MKGLSGALEGAFAVVLGQNALLLARILYELLTYPITKSMVVILLFSIINISAVATNWVSCRQRGNSTTDLSFFLDIMTLSAFFGVSYILNENFKNMTLENLLLIISIFYCIIHILFILWNLIMIRQNVECSFLFMKSNYKNAFAVCIYIVIFIFHDISIAYIIFELMFLYWIYILCYYLYNLVSTEIPMYICLAEWFGPRQNIIKQYFISFKSHLTKIFATYQKDAAKIYFSEIYNGKDDPYLFDGKKDGYYDGLLHAAEILKNKNIIDLGCGTGTLYKWLKKKQISINSYTGVDFAVKNTTIDKKVRIIRKRIEKYSTLYNKHNIVIASNVLCYLSDDQLEQLMISLTYAEYIIILEPIKSLFWDAYFDNVQLFYRKRKEIIKIFSDAGFKIKGISISYGIKFFQHYFIKLSNCLIFHKELN